MTYGVMGLPVMIYSGGDHQRTHICEGHSHIDKHLSVTFEQNSLINGPTRRPSHSVLGYSNI